MVKVEDMVNKFIAHSNGNELVLKIANLELALY